MPIYLFPPFAILSNTRPPIVDFSIFPIAPWFGFLSIPASITAALIAAVATLTPFSPTHCPGRFFCRNASKAAADKPAFIIWLRFFLLSTERSRSLRSSWLRRVEEDRGSL